MGREESATLSLEAVRIFVRNFRNRIRGAGSTRASPSGAVFALKLRGWLGLSKPASVVLYRSLNDSFGSVAQLVRALPCHGRGCGFESRPSRHKGRSVEIPIVFCIETVMFNTKSKGFLSSKVSSLSSTFGF